MNGELCAASARSPSLTSANRERAKTTLNGKRLLSWTRRNPKMMTMKKSLTSLLITLSAPDVKSSWILTFALPILVVAILSEAVAEDVAVVYAALTERCAVVAVEIIAVMANNAVEVEISVNEVESSVNNVKVEIIVVVSEVTVAKALDVVATSVGDAADLVLKADVDLAVNECQLLLK